MASAMPMQAAPQPAVQPYPQTPVLQSSTAVGLLLANVIVPGLGTLIAGIMSGKPLVGRAVAQFFLTLILVGWVWSVVTGVQMLSNASWADRTGARRDA